MKEFLNSLLEVSKERIKNPLIGSFIFAWFVFNWKPLLYLLFSDDTMPDKIITIENKYINIYDNLVLPIGFAIFYIVILPYVMWGLEELYMKAKSERLMNKKDEEILTILNKQETTRANLKLENIKADYRETSELNLKIKKLEELEEVLKVETETLKKELIRHKAIHKQKDLELKKQQDYIAEITHKNEDKNNETSKQLDILQKANKKLTQKEDSYEVIIKRKDLEIKELLTRMKSSYSHGAISEAERMRFGFEYINDFEDTELVKEKSFENICLFILDINTNFESIKDVVQLAVDKDLIYRIESKKFGFTKKGLYFWDVYLKNKLREDFTEKNS